MEPEGNRGRERGSWTPNPWARRSYRRQAERKGLGMRRGTYSFSATSWQCPYRGVWSRPSKGLAARGRWLESPRVRCWRMPVSSASCALSLPGLAHDYFRAPPSSTMRNHAPFRYPLATSVWEGGNHRTSKVFLLINWESRIPYLGYVVKRKSNEFDWARFMYRTTILYNINSNRNAYQKNKKKVIEM